MKISFFEAHIYYIWLGGGGGEGSERTDNKKSTEPKVNGSNFSPLEFNCLLNK